MHIKLADFGAAKFSSSSDEVEDFQGTLSYVSPEMVKREQTTIACDIWALGVIMFRLYSGAAFPFEGEDEDETFDQILNSEVEFPSGIPSDAMDIIKLMLSKDPASRSDPTKFKQHPYFKGKIKFETLFI